MVNVVKTLDGSDIEDICKKILYRQSNYDEPLMLALGIVLMNYGDQYVEVTCTRGEWIGAKGELTLRNGIPLCPNNHPLIEFSLSPRLALVQED